MGTQSSFGKEGEKRREREREKEGEGGERSSAPPSEVPFGTLSPVTLEWEALPHSLHLGPPYHKWVTARLGCFGASLGGSSLDLVQYSPIAGRGSGLSSGKIKIGDPKGPKEG